jgi:hypothetical protein
MWIYDSYHTAVLTHSPKNIKISKSNTGQHMKTKEINNKITLNIKILSYQIWTPTLTIRSRDSVVSIATGYGLDNQGVGVQVPVGSRIVSSPCRSDWLWGPPNLLPNGYQEISFPRGKAAGGVKLTTHLQLVLRSKKCGSIHPLPICLHGTVLN